jgi:hypothetical protein
VRVLPDLFLALAEQPDGLLGFAAALVVELVSYLGRLLVENITIDAPAAHELERIPVQACHLDFFGKEGRKFCVNK